MLRDESVVVESGWSGGAGEEPWRDLDRQLRSVAKRRGALDHEELTLIREAVATQLWRPLGMTSMREYLERRMGYGPQVAAERLRVAEALEALPAIEQALADNELSYSAVRELTRIATRKTDEAWVKACRGKAVCEVEAMVAEREPGDGPDSKPKPLLRRKRFAADLLPDVDALVRQARQILEAEYGEKLDNDELMRAFAARVLEPAAIDGKAQRPRHQIAVTICKACKQGWQNGAGREVPISAIDLELALCDAQHVGDLDGAPCNLTQNIPAANRRFVWRRDRGRCVVPGCRAAACIDVHHLRPREHGGTHEATNLALLCAGHHRALHAGLIVIEGTAPDIRVIRLTEVPHMGESDPSEVPSVEESELIEVPHVGEPPEEAPLDANPSIVPHVKGPHEANRLRFPHVGEPSDEATRNADPSYVPLGDRAQDIRDDARAIADVQGALVRLGFRRDEARAAVQRARAQVGANADLEALMRASLRECPKPGSS
jgi:hypothetical protein